MTRTERERLFLLLRAASRYESRTMKRANQQQRGYLIRNFAWWFQVVPFAVAAIIAIARSYYGASENVAIAGLIFLLVSYVATLLHPFILAWVHRRTLVVAAKNPIGLLFDNANATTRVDARLITRLLRSPIEHLELLHVELKSEREFFERRLSLIVGSVEKIGLAPGLLATSISLSNLKSTQTDWITALAYMTPVLYVLGVVSHFLLMRLDRFTKIVELAVAQQKSLTIASTGTAKMPAAR